MYSYFKGFEPSRLLCIYTQPFILLATKNYILKEVLAF